MEIYDIIIDDLVNRGWYIIIKVVGSYCLAMGPTTRVFSKDELIFYRVHGNLKKIYIFNKKSHERRRLDF